LKGAVRRHTQRVADEDANRRAALLLRHDAVVDAERGDDLKRYPNMFWPWTAPSIASRSRR
jgi:hypothetical protein